MGIPVYYIWVTRAKCENCGQYSWTNHHNESIICACGHCTIDFDGIITGGSVVDETEFFQAVSDSVFLKPDETLELMQG
jgi:ribosomal protein S27AE